MILPLLATARAGTYYVSVNGSDGNPGTAAAPFRHVSKGVASATSPGDTVVVMNGTYDNEGVTEPNYVVTLYHSGTSGNNITIMAQNRGMAILDGGNSSNGSSCNGAASYFNLYNASFVTIQGFVIQNACDSGFQSNDSAHDITIRWNEIRNIGNWYITDQYGRDGIYLNNSEYNFTFDGNTWHDIGRTGGQSDLHFDHGIYAHATNVTIVNNLFYNMNRGWSIQTADGAANWLVANNTFAFPNANGEDGQIMFWGGNSNMTICNNIFYQPANAATTQFGATLSGEYDHNIVYGVGTFMSNGGGLSQGSGNLMGSNPMFTNAASAPYNFSLQNGSPAVMAGVYISSVPYDIMGAVRPAGATTNIGAYQGGAAANGPSGGSGGGGGGTSGTVSGVAATGITSGAAVINWTTNIPTSSSVEFGMTTSYGSSTGVNSTMTTTHAVAVVGLNPSTTYHFYVAGFDQNGNLVQSGDFTLTTLATPETFSLSAAPVSVFQGQSAKAVVTASMLTGSPVVVAFNSSTMAGLTTSFSATSCTATCSTTLTISAASTLAAGVYTLNITGSGAGVSASASLNVTVGAIGPVIPVTPVTPTGDATTGLVARWKLNESSGTVAHDSSPYGNNGTVYNGYWWTSVHGPCLWFDGSGSYVNVPENGSLDMTNALTVAFWLDPNQNRGSDPRIIAKLYDWDIKLNGSTNRYPQFETSAGQFAMLNFSPGLQTWHHIAFTYSNGTVKGYVDGVAVPFVQNTFTGSGTLASWKYGLYLGWDSSQQNPFIGSLADVRIYNRALSPADIAAVFAGH